MKILEIVMTSDYFPHQHLLEKLNSHSLPARRCVFQHHANFEPPPGHTYVTHVGVEALSRGTEQGSGSDHLHVLGTKFPGRNLDA